MKNVSTFFFVFFSWVTIAFSQNYRQGELIIWTHQAPAKELVIKWNQQNSGAGFYVKRKLAHTYYVYLIGFDTLFMPTTQALYFCKRADKVAIAQYNHNNLVQRAIPSDANFGSQWSLNNTGQNGGTPDADIDAVEAWNITTGGTTALGDTIVVAVIDGGCYFNHPDLQNNMFKNYDEIPNNSVDDDGNGYIDDFNGWNAYNNDGNVQQSNHGTHVSGIIGAVGNNSTGVAGVNWHVKVLPVSGSSGNEATVVAAYGYVADMRKLYNQTGGAKGAFIVSTNSSFGVNYGDPASYPIWCAFYDTMGVQGILSAVAGPNLNIDIDVQGDVPGACPSNYTLSITNTTRNDQRNNSAGYGVINCDLGSPGTNILNTYNNNNYNSLTGTSMATPHVAGSIALCWSAACAKMVTDYKNNPDSLALIMRQYIFDGVDTLADLTGITATNGRLNVYNSILLVQKYICVAPQAGFSASTLSACPNTAITFNNTTSGNSVSYNWQFPGGMPSTSTLFSPTVSYAQTGTYSATLIATNPVGSDTLTFNNYININLSSTKEIYRQDFETGNFSTTNWTTTNPDGQNTWELANVAGNSPGDTAAYLNLFDNAALAPTSDALISPFLDFSAFTQVKLTFEHAYRQRNANTNDSLFVGVSTNNGISWQQHLAVAEDGTGALATVNASNSAFAPQDSSEWCTHSTFSSTCFTLDLSAYDNQDSIKIRFSVENNGGNNFYLDNVSVSGVCSGKLNIGTENINNQLLILFPNPAKAMTQIRFSKTWHNAKVAVFDAYGRLIYTTKLQTSPKKLYLNLKAGIYFVRINKNGQQIVKKLIWN